MVQHYTHLPFVDKDEHFTPLTIYVRKPPVITEMILSFTSQSKGVGVKELEVG
jgi:hypothetical protein